MENKKKREKEIWIVKDGKKGYKKMRKKIIGNVIFNVERREKKIYLIWKKGKSN